MQTMTVSEVSKAFEVSTRMLRYYENIGLITSFRKPDYAYRIYDDKAVRRLQLIIVLRKLRISLKQISVILDNTDYMKALEILSEKIAEVSDEIDALNTIKKILLSFSDKLRNNMQLKTNVDLLDNNELISIANALSLSNHNLKEKLTMENLNSTLKTTENKMDIRIVYLPPATVASSHYFGKNPEDPSGEKLAEFIRKSNLPEIKPDFRVYGFNNPSPTNGKEEYGYEFLVTIPDEFEVTAPLEKKHFAGGLYAAHCIKMGDFQEWQPFFELISKSAEYDIDWREPNGMGGSLEEELNAYSVYTGKIKEAEQLDLLIPIKRK